MGYAPVAGGTATTLVTGAPNPRTVAVYNNTLFYTTASGTAGIFLLGTPGVISTAASQVSSAVSATGTYPNLSPSTFQFQSASVLWVCDDGAATTSYGVWKLSGTFGGVSSYTGEHGVPAFLHFLIASPTRWVQPRQLRRRTDPFRQPPALISQGR